MAQLLDPEHIHLSGFDLAGFSTEKTYEVTDMFAEPPANGSRMYNIKLNIDKALRKNLPLIQFLPRNTWFQWMSHSQIWQIEILLFTDEYRF